MTSISQLPRYELFPLLLVSLHLISPSLRRLSRLILTSNKLATLLPLSASSPSPPPSSIHPVRPTSLPTLRTLRHLSLSHNLLTSWSDLDALNDRTTFPLLSSLSVEGFSFGAPEDELRLLVIARVGSLVELDGSKVRFTLPALAWSRFADIGRSLDYGSGERGRGTILPLVDREGVQRRDSGGGAGTAASEVARAVGA